MDKALFDQYVQDRYRGQMEYYSKSSAKNQGKYSKLQWFLIVLSALTPVFAALSSFKPDIIAGIDFKIALNLMVIIVSVIVAILTTGLKTFNYQELWVGYRSTYELLKPEIHYYNFNVGPYAGTGVDKESLFVARVEGILKGEHVSWPIAKKQSDKDEKHNTDQSEQQPATSHAEPEAKDEGKPVSTKS